MKDILRRKVDAVECVNKISIVAGMVKRVVGDLLESKRHKFSKARTTTPAL